MFLRKLLESLVMCFQVADEGAVGFDDDLMLVTEVNYCSLLAPWV
jgi:hypothetical protein